MELKYYEPHLSFKRSFVICVCSCKRAPDPLLAACIFGNSSGVLQLLRVGSSGLPDDLLRYLITHGHLDSSPHMINMVQILLELGVIEPALYSKLQQYFPETSSDIQIKTTAALLGNYVWYSLDIVIIGIETLYMT
jgi:hypothetical protein